MFIFQINAFLQWGILIEATQIIGFSLVMLQGNDGSNNFSLKLAKLLKKIYENKIIPHFHIFIAVIYGQIRNLHCLNGVPGTDWLRVTSWSGKWRPINALASDWLQLG